MFRQGRKFNEGFKNMCIEGLDPLEQIDVDRAITSTSGITNYETALGYQETINQTNEKQDAVIDSINAKIVTLNTLVAHYKSLYNWLGSEIVTNNTALGSYGRKNVRTDEGTAAGAATMYHINKFGFKHKYTDAAWTGKHTSCGSTNEIVSGDQLSAFVESGDMGVGQPCGYTGSMIKSTSGTIAWVDIEGYKHNIPTGVTPIDCDITTYTNLSDEEFNAIPVAYTYTAADKCINTNVSPSILPSLTSLKVQINVIIGDISTEMKSLTTDDAGTLTTLGDIDTLINDTKIILDNDEIIIQKQLPYNVQLNNQLTDSDLKVNSSYIKYIIWSIVCFAILAITYYTFLSENSSILVYIVIALLVLYVIYSEVIPKIQNIRYVGS